MGQPSRRALLRAGVAGVVTAVLPGTGVARAASDVADATPTRLRRSVFAAHVGTTLVLASGSASYRAVLVAVEDSSPADAGADHAFGLLFRVASHDRPPAGTYSVTHARLRAFPLYVGPVTADPRVYQAIVQTR